MKIDKKGIDFAISLEDAQNIVNTTETDEISIPLDLIKVLKLLLQI